MRGYGAGWQKIRAMWDLVVKAGRGVCWRCGKPIAPDEPWDLGHVDGSNKTLVAGPEHRRCNRATARHRVRSVSQEW